MTKHTDAPDTCTVLSKADSEILQQALNSPPEPTPALQHAGIAYCKMPTKTTEVRYGLRHKTTGELAKYSVISNEGRDFCGDFTYTLSQYGEEDWMCESLHILDCVLSGISTPWYNSELETPVVNIRIEDYTPVKISVTKTTEHVSMEPSLIVLQESILAFDYKEKMGMIPEHSHRHLVCYLVEDYTKYSDKIGAKVHTVCTMYRILVWAGMYQGRNMLILSNEYGGAL